jgi:hypothetical protein
MPQSPQRHAPIRALCALAPALLLFGCAGISVKSTWQDGVPHQTFTRLLVVGLTPDYNLRCDFEYAFASQISSATTKAFASCDSMKSDVPLTRENIERVIAKLQADGVLTTRLVSARTGTQQGGTLDTIGTSEYKATDFGYGPYGMPVTYVDFQTAPPLTNITSTIHIFTKLYDSHDGKVLYTLDTQTKPQQVDSTQALLATITAPMADRLRRDGVIH